MQEAGRAGRNPSLKARCFVLYSDNDLDKHFILLNQTKLSLSEIQQVWQAIKNMTKQRSRVCCSALEIARQAGWDDSVSDIETRVRTALSALEQSSYIERGNNVPHVYATGITVKNLDEARKRITDSILFDKEETEKAVRIIKSLISQKYISKAQDTEAESRVDYLADILGISKSEVVSVVERMRQEGILADTKDISAYLQDVGDSEHKTKTQLERYTKLERYILSHIPDQALQISYKQLNDNAQNDDVTSSNEKDIRTLLYFLTIKGYTRKTNTISQTIEVARVADLDATIKRFEKRLYICQFAINWLYRLKERTINIDTNKNAIQFSVIELLNDIKKGRQSLIDSAGDVQLFDVEEALLYMSKIGALKLEGGFLVLYNAMDIRRKKERSNRYKVEDYRLLDEFYKQKTQQVHIVGEYANLMVKDYNAALQYVQDYFQMDYKKFITKYFKGERITDLGRNITPYKYKQLFAELSPKQMEIISDKESRCIVVAAGPGSGKTRVLVHKLASLLLMEDVKHEQLLMLTFSRAAATEFKQRLMELIGNAAHFVEIKTFHAYCFDLLGRIGNIEDAKDVVSKAAKMINDGEVEPTKIGKTVLVIDEAQDMSDEEFQLVRALMARNEEMRVIAVGDDDQNIYQFRGSSSKYMAQLASEKAGRFVEMVDNYRSARHIVTYANEYVKRISQRMKKTPIHSMSKQDGLVNITYYHSENMYEPLAKELMLNQNGGKTCVLTQTNEEAQIVVALLRKYRCNTKLIQTLDGFPFYNLVEVRYFLKHISKRILTPVITDEVWMDAKNATFLKYDRSTTLDILKRCIKIFEETNKTKYYNDFLEYVYESSVEDFCDYSNADIIVSTIHKAKGREFDDVYMLINKGYPISDDLMRRRYVGITRAKKRLFIHTNDSSFQVPGYDNYSVDTTTYLMPDKINVSLTHKDIYLDFCKTRKNEILALRSGDSLIFRDNILYDTSGKTALVSLSAKMQKELADWKVRGYEVVSATAQFVVAWKPKDSKKSDPEYAVLLADLCLERNNSVN